MRIRFIKSEQREGLRMRDKIKTIEYFNRAKTRYYEEIIRYERIVESVLYEKGENDRGVKNGFNILINAYENYISCLYSSGEDVSSIYDVFIKLLRIYSKMWNKEYGYIELVRNLSIAVMLEVDKESIKELENKIIEERFNDYFVNRLINSIDNSWDISNSNVEFTIYDTLKEILVESGNTLVDLKEYLRKDWYKLHAECSWYNSHKSKNGTYCGYWSFETGAVVKLLELDDNSLKDIKYYPYDLVHYAMS